MENITRSQPNENIIPAHQAAEDKAFFAFAGRGMSEVKSLFDRLPASEQRKRLENLEAFYPAGDEPEDVFLRNFIDDFKSLLLQEAK